MSLVARSGEITLTQGFHKIPTSELPQYVEYTDNVNEFLNRVDSVAEFGFRQASLDLGRINIEGLRVTLSHPPEDCRYVAARYDQYLQVMSSGQGDMEQQWNRFLEDYRKLVVYLNIPDASQGITPRDSAEGSSVVCVVLSIAAVVGVVAVVGIAAAAAYATLPAWVTIPASIFLGGGAIILGSDHSRAKYYREVIDLAQSIRAQASELKKIPLLSSSKIFVRSPLITTTRVECVSQG